MKYVSLLVISALAAACGKSTPKPEKEPPPAVSAAPLAPSASAASVEREPEKVAIPTLVPEPFEPARSVIRGPFAVEGAIMVSDGQRAGRLVDAGVEWIGATIPDMYPGLGQSHIIRVRGVYPDAIDVETSTMGRAPMDTLFPLTGKGVTRLFGEGGTLGWIFGTARVGDTTLVAGFEMGGGYEILTVRGPTLVIKPIRGKKAGCTEKELEKFWGTDDPAALAIRSVAATERGTLVTVGLLCDRDTSPAAEVWDEPGKSRIIELSGLVKKIGYYSELHRGKGDELFLEADPVLRYRGGKFEPLPVLDKPIKSIFVSPGGALHGISGATIVRLDEDKWTVVANLPWSLKLSNVVMDDKGTFWTSHNGIARLREAKGDEAVDTCKAPFVFLYDVSWKNENNFSFPTTRKALSTFPEVGEISLVEYREPARRLGVIVKSREQGEAVIKHVKANMKDEEPELICYAPKSPRVIEMKGGK